MKLKHILSAAVLAFGLVSCSNEVQDTIGDQQMPLQITANIESTRAAGVEDTEFKSGEYIGFFVDGIDNAWNVLATYNTNEKRWMLDNTNIMLNSNERQVVAYYPLEEWSTMEHYYGFRLTPGTNHLVSTGTTVNNQKPVANLKFKHVMARIQLVITNPAKTAIKNVVLEGENIYNSALYSFYKNEIDYWMGSQAATIDNTQPIEGEVQTLDALLIPAPAGETNLTLNFADGKTYTTTVYLPELKMGGYYRLPISLGGNSEEHEYVDLGLPSGLKWATCNVGASSPEEYGDYFAWGETEPKEDYSWETYKWCKGTKETMTKYCTEISFGTVDKKTILELEDDVAHVNWGGNWRMPTDSEILELRENCTWTWTTQNGVNGYRVTGANGKCIFVPAAGYRGEKDSYNVGSIGYYWSNALTKNRTITGSSLYINSENHYTDLYEIRSHGQSVRPVTE